MRIENISFKDFFNILKNKPERFLLRKDLTLLDYFLNFFPFYEVIIKEDIKFLHLVPYKNFEYYVLGFLKEKGLLEKMNHNTVAWSEWIISVCSNQDEAWDLFFKILDQFIEDIENGLLPEEAYLMPVSDRKQRNIGRYMWPDDMNEN